MQWKFLPLCPRSWKILLLLNEQKAIFDYKTLSLNSLEINPLYENGTDISYIFENLMQLFDTKLIAEYGRWFSKFEHELVTEIILPIRYERVIKPIVHRISPDMTQLQQKRQKLKKFLIEVAEILNERNWFVGNRFTFADMTFAAAVAVLDYLGEIQWENEQLKGLRNLYSNVKSRESFTIILEQKCYALTPHINFFKREL